MIEQATIAQLRKLYQNLRDEPIERTDPRYVELFEDPRLSSVDPVARLSRCIQFAGRDSSQLFRGHRGTGKSTQLLRLKHELEQVADYKVVVCDMEKYLPMTDEVEVVDFLLGAAGALSEALSGPELLGDDAVASDRPRRMPRSRPTPSASTRCGPWRTSAATCSGCSAIGRLSMNWRWPRAATCAICSSC